MEVETINGKTKQQIENRLAITIQGLKVWTAEEKSWWRKKPTKQKMMILNDVSGTIKDGEFCAVLGPSGAGKTTFLVSLAGKCTLPSEGTVLVNGTNVRDSHAVEIVPQFEVFFDGLTVMEHLVFMTEMKLGSSKKPINQRTMVTLLQDLKLKALVGSRVCELSGGEKRLLSLATCLLSSPKILISDEPTTGLDSYNALLVIQTLKKLSQSGKIVVCSIHQPSCDIFREFSSLMLMSDGRLLFHGTLEECQAVFERINLHCPLNYNPAEFYIRAVSSQNQGYVEQLMGTYQDRPVPDYETSSNGTDASVEHIRPLRRNWFKQVHLLLWRQSLTLKRDIKNHLFQLFLSVAVTALVIGTCYIGITGTTSRGVQDIRGFLWLITSEVCFCLAYNALYVFEYEIPLFKREVGVYKCSAFFVARFLSFIPRCVVWSVTLVTVATLTVQLPNHIVTTLELIAALTAASVASLAYGNILSGISTVSMRVGLGMAALFTSTGIMGDVMPCADLPLFLMSGAFLRISSMPLWLYPVKFLSHFYYAMDAVSNVYWRQIGDIECQWNSTSCAKDGRAVLLENGYSEDFVMQDGIGLLCVTLLWGVLGYCGLKREEKKGYAY